MCMFPLQSISLRVFWSLTWKRASTAQRKWRDSPGYITHPKKPEFFKIRYTKKKNTLASKDNMFHKGGMSNFSIVKRFFSPRVSQVLDACNSEYHQHIDVIISMLCIWIQTTKNNEKIMATASSVDSAIQLRCRSLNDTTVKKCLWEQKLLHTNYLTDMNYKNLLICCIKRSIMINSSVCPLSVWIPLD